MTMSRTSWPRFKVGQRVRPSRYGIERNVFAGVYHGQRRRDRSGVVVKVSEFGAPTVLWDGYKQAKGYFPGFIVHDRRRTKQPSAHDMKALGAASL